MSRVERTQNPSDRPGSEQRHTQRGRNAAANAPRRDPNPGHTPTKAEGEVSDVEEALERSEN